MTAYASNPLGRWVALAAAVLILATIPLTAAETAFTLASPNGRVAVEFSLTDAGAPQYTVRRDGRAVLQPSDLGLVRDDADFRTGLRTVSLSEPETVTDTYEILTAKRRHNRYEAQRRTIRLESPDGHPLEIVFQVSDDGVAFRYRFPDTSDRRRRLREEATSFHLLPGSRAWLQPMAVAKSGWEATNPSYEELYEKDIPVGTPSPTGAGWVYPALFRSGDTWLLISEADLSRHYCGTRLASASPDGEYRVAFPDPREGRGDGPVAPESTLPWETPWRLVVVGSLETIVESMLGVHLAAPPAPLDAPPVAPGKASWSWPLLGDPNTTYDVQRQFIDYAAEMGWRYTLIDALWDQQIGTERIQELIEYAAAKDVQILLWYNSAGDWNTAPQTPRDRLLTRESRKQEFDRLKAMGVAGLKIDFFGGDGQSMINYYHDLLEETRPYGFALNFHGATLPRGWQRTYPHLMTMESVRGLEFITFEQANADQAPTHVPMLPFTRNVFDPMDFTPVVLDRINRIERRTSSAYELALSVLLTSGIQHYAEIPAGLAKAPGYVRDFLREVPVIWDDIEFLAGHPGEYVVLARRAGSRWYVAGINGSDQPRSIALDCRELGLDSARGSLIYDGEGGNLSFRRADVALEAGTPQSIPLAGRGGFTLTLE